MSTQDNRNSDNAAVRALDGSRRWTLTVSKDFDTLQLDVSGDLPSIDEGINMLQQALRSLEDKRRLAALAQAQAQIAEQARAQSIVNSVRDNLRRN